MTIGIVAGMGVLPTDRRFGCFVCAGRPRRRRWSGDRGFTMLELLAVLAVVSVLTAIVAASFSGALQSAQGGSARVAVHDAESAVHRLATVTGAPLSEAAIVAYLNAGAQRDGIYNGNVTIIALSSSTITSCADYAALAATSTTVLRACLVAHQITSAAEPTIGVAASADGSRFLVATVGSDDVVYVAADDNGRVTLLP